MDQRGISSRGRRKAVSIVNRQSSIGHQLTAALVSQFIFSPAAVNSKKWCPIMARVMALLKW